MKIIPAILFAFLSISLNAQEYFQVEIEPFTVTNAPGVHSFSWGKATSNNWVILGGRIDGLHQRQPFAAFLESDNNKTINIIDPVNNQSWSTALGVLPSAIYEQLQSTNQQFYQNGNTLYIIGGYGYSTTQADHITYDKLTAVDLDGVENAVKNGNSIIPFFRQISNPNFAVTGGQMGILNGSYYLCGGQKFTGRYNPMGGPSYVQDYVEEIRKFDIVDDGTNLSISNYTSTTDVTNLHRRDYNMSPQIFPNGDEGFTMFSGVFDPNDLPYLNSVDVTASGHTTNNNFTQYLSQYHSAKLPIYDADSNVMHTLFFGGMSQYTLDASGNLVKDDEVPFVKTISKVSRFNDGSMTETKLDIEMPTLVGSGAEFIPVHDANIFDSREILMVNNLPVTKTLVGYIYGGIESTAANIFFSNTGSQSSASNVIFKVYISKPTLGTNDTQLTADNIFNLKVFPNPATNHLGVDVFIPNHNLHELVIMDLGGREIQHISLPKTVGNHSQKIDISTLSKGSYLIKIRSGNYSSTQKFIKVD